MFAASWLASLMRFYQISIKSKQVLTLFRFTARNKYRNKVVAKRASKLDEARYASFA